MASLPKRLRRRRLVDPDRYVWIAGSPRSGSTWLLSLLSQAPDTARVFEPSIGLHLGITVDEIVGARLGEPGSPPARILDGRAERPGYFFSSASREAWQPALRQLLIERLSLGQRGGRAAPLLLIKEPDGSRAIDVILGTLPESRLLLLLRDGRDVIASLLDGLGPGGWISELSDGTATAVEDDLGLIRELARRWHLAVATAQRAYEEHPGALRHRIRYEDLRTDPIPALQAIVAWLGLDLDSEAALAKLDLEQVPAEERGVGKFIGPAEVGRWRQRLSPQQIEVIEAEAGPMLRSLGYQ